MDCINTVVAPPTTTPYKKEECFEIHCLHVGAGTSSVVGTCSVACDTSRVGATSEETSVGTS